VDGVLSQAREEIESTRYCQNATYRQGFWLLEWGYFRGETGCAMAKDDPMNRDTPMDVTARDLKVTSMRPVFVSPFHRGTTGKWGVVESRLRGLCRPE
jgi:hypothetical protein